MTDTIAQHATLRVGTQAWGVIAQLSSHMARSPGPRGQNCRPNDLLSVVLVFSHNHQPLCIYILPSRGVSEEEVSVKRSFWRKGVFGEKEVLVMGWRINVFQLVETGISNLDDKKGFQKRLPMTGLRLNFTRYLFARVKSKSKATKGFVAKDFRIA